MSARRQSWKPLALSTEVERAEAAYASRRRRDPADITVLPVPAEADAWCDGLAAAARAIGGAATVIASWAALRWWLGI